MARPYPWIPFYSRSCSGFFASSLAIIHLNKLSTLSLRDIPPLKPFERRDQPADIYEDFVYMAIYNLTCTAPPAKPEYQCLNSKGNVATCPTKIISRDNVPNEKRISRGKWQLAQ